MKSYFFHLIRNGEVLDETSIDYNDIKFATELFYTEFGHSKKKEDEIKFVGFGYE